MYQFVLGQLATVSLKKNKTQGLLKRGKPLTDSKDSISLTNLVAYIESKFSSEMVTNSILKGFSLGFGQNTVSSPS